VVHIEAKELESILAQVFRAAGSDDESAQEIAESLVENNLMGHDSHGALRVDMYTRMMDRGSINPKGAIETVRESATTAIVDGGRHFGILVARKAMDLAVAKATEHDLGLVVVRNCGHTGRMGEYSVRAAKAGCVGMVMGSGSAKGGTVALFGSRDRALNTNPLSWAVPAGRHPPLFFDFATSVVAYGKVQVAEDKGIPLPLGWIIDAQGQPSTKPEDLGQGGALLPFGEHKGSALALMVEILSNGLAFASCAPLAGYEPDFTMMLMAIRVEAFISLDAFKAMVDDTIDTIKGGRPAVDVAEILLPGEPEWRTRDRRAQDGIDLPYGTWQRIVDTGARYGLEIQR